MKNRLALILTLITAVMLSWTGCTPAENNVTGKLEFGKEIVSAEQLKSIVPDAGEISAALVTITDATGRVVFDKEPVSFYKFGEAFISQSLTLEIGSYMLSEFFLIDTSGNVLWAAPLEGSELAHLVDHPLPLAFTIREQQTTTVTPQVVWIGDYTPEQFGYVSFGVDFVGSFCLEVFYNTNCWDTYPEDSIYYWNYEPFSYPYYAASIEIFGDNNFLMGSSLGPEINTFRINNIYSWYTILVMNCKMDTVFNARISKEELARHRCGLGNPLFIDDNTTDPDIVITPEGLIEPTIDQGVFGRMTISEPDSSNNGTYSVFPVIADLYIYPGYLFDSIYNYIDDSCCFPADLFPELPLSIVRSNSDGYFQLRMETGYYLYMVEMPWGGFYIDLYLNSRKGGELIINEAEITKLYINIAYDIYASNPEWNRPD